VISDFGCSINFVEGSAVSDVRFRILVNVKRALHPQKYDKSEIEHPKSEIPFL